MAGQEDEREAATGGVQAAGKTGEGTAGALQEGEPEAEQESAAAMDADVPQPPGTAETTEGQPS